MVFKITFLIIVMFWKFLLYFFFNVVLITYLLLIVKYKFIIVKKCLFFSSLRTENNLKTVSELPINCLMLETDCPWCEIKPTHPSYSYVQTKFNSVKKEKYVEGSMVKGRNEPSTIK